MQYARSRSGCYFCFFQQKIEWVWLYEQHPDRFAKAMEYEKEQRGRTEKEIWDGLANAWTVMKDAVHTGLEEDMTSRSGMINNGAKKVYRYPKPVLSKEFQNLISRALAAKEVNSCMGRIVAAPTAGASGIMPGVLYTLQEIHHIEDKKILEAMLLAAGIALIMVQKASIAGGVGGGLGARFFGLGFAATSMGGFQNAGSPAVNSFGK